MAAVGGSPVALALQEGQAVEARVLGPLEVGPVGAAAPLGGPKPRTLLAALLAAQGAPLTVERLGVELWVEGARARGATALQTHASRLRRALQHLGATVAHSSAGYALVGQLSIDAAAFDVEASAARSAAARGDAATALAHADAALAWWRGPAYADVEGGPLLSAEAARLDEARFATGELRAEAALSLGRVAEAIAGLEALTVARPWRERPVGLLLVALYRGGRQADALLTYQRTRQRLRDELGIEPGPELAALHRQILTQDPGLQAPLPYSRESRARAATSSRSSASADAAVRSGAPRSSARDQVSSAAARRRSPRRRSTSSGLQRNPWRFCTHSK